MSTYAHLDFSDGHLASWRSRALCRGMSEVFFPEMSEASDVFDQRQEDCKAICHECPVQQQCREWALEDPFGEGIDLVLGGMSYRERYRVGKMRRRNNL